MVKEAGIVQKLRDVFQEVLGAASQESLQPQEVHRILEEIASFRLQLQGITEYLARYSQKKDEWQRLCGALATENAGVLCEKLRQYGFRLRGDEAVRERVYDSKEKKPKGLVYRILELTRLGKRDEVFFSLFNIFQGVEISPDLAKAFSPVYSDELFKTFVYSFLSGLLGQKGTSEEVET